jgi:hypothetical protein
VAIIAAALVGVSVFLAVQALLRSPELGWLADGFGHLRGRARGRMAAEAQTGTASRRRDPRPRLIPPSPSLPWRGLRLRHRSSYWVAVLALPGAVALGVMCVLWPLLTAGVVLAAGLAAAVWAWPALAAYLIIVLTPVTAGINRGSALPIVRPNEALALFLGGTLAVRGVVRLRTGQLPKIRPDRLEVAFVLMAVASSVLPLLWMAVRQTPISKDDLLYALVLWKFLGLYVIIRTSVTDERQIKRCLWLSVGAACFVAVLAILQSVGLFGVPDLLVKYFAPFGNTNAFADRGGSTLGLPAATADLSIINLAIVSGLWIRYRRFRPLLAAAAGLLVLGVLSAGEFSSAIGLFVGVICIAAVMRRPKLLWVFLPAAVLGGLALRPVIERRLAGFQSASGLPVSWTGRLQNLQTYFWPRLFSNWHFLLGIQPSARIAVASQATGYVWIESGYTWLLWGGGLPLLAGFGFFAYAAARRGWQGARGDRDGRSVAGLAVFAGITVITVLMSFDPHLTYRGSADAFYCLLALAAPRVGRPGSERPGAQPMPALRGYPPNGSGGARRLGTLPELRAWPPDGSAHDRSTRTLVTEVRK